jgi:catechol 2,3-dioxygenase-like lactoylglutathione lyase family enzyme
MSDRFHHVSLTAADFDKTVAFYRDTLHWGMKESWGGRGQARGAILSGGGMKVVVVEREGGAAEGGGEEAGRPRLHLDIHDIDSRFRAMPPGDHVVTPPERTPWGTRWFVVRDPDGNLIAFEEVHKHGG